MNFAERLFTVKGGISSMRWVFVWVAFVSVGVPILSWAVVYVQHDGIGDIPSGVVTLCSLAFATVTGGKWLQAKEEQKANVS